MNPTQVVQKKSGITVVQNDKGEYVSTCLTMEGVYQLQEVECGDKEGPFLVALY